MCQAEFLSARGYQIKANKVTEIIDNYNLANVCFKNHRINFSKYFLYY